MKLTHKANFFGESAKRPSNFVSIMALMAMFAAIFSTMLPTVTVAVAAPVKPHISSYTVTDTSDYITDTGSLRYAVSQANSGGGGNISFDPTLTSGGAVTITLSSVLSVTSPITITGPGTDLLTISGNNATQIFAVDNSGTCTTAICQLNITDLTIADGKAANGAKGYDGSSATAGSDGSSGGAISNNGGSVSLANVVMSNNVAGQGGTGGSASSNSGGNGGNGGNGGAIYSHSGSLTISSSTFISNSGGIGGVAGPSCNGPASSGNGGNGGAIYSDNNATVTITASTFVSNTGGVGGAGTDPNPSLGCPSTVEGTAGTGGSGGAIYEDSSLILINSTLTGNSSGAGGGGYIAGNGGAIYNDGTVIITNTTIVSNTVGIGGNGGGIGNGQASLTLANSIVAGNSASDTTTNDINDEFGYTSNGYNVIGIGTGNVTAGTGDDIGTTASPVDPKVAPLADNGGSTETMALLTGSPAIGRVATGCLATDQRGVARPATNCDSGAYQTITQVTSTITLTSAPNPSTYGQPITFTATVSPTSATGTVTFTIGSASVTSTPSSGTATYVTNTLSVGVYTVTATYGGDIYDTSSTSNTITQTVNAASPTISLTSAPNPSTVGQSVTFTATVNPSVTGTVTFTNTTSNTTLGTAPIGANGTAVISTTFANSGSYSITATYSGNVSYTSSTSNVLVQVVTPTTIVTGTTYTYYLPFVANNASNFTTYLAVQNIGGASATITITYYDNSGNVLNGSTVVTQVAQYGEILPSNPLASGARGAGVITSNQPLNVIVPEATPYGGSAYAVNSGSSSSLIAPFAINNAFGDFVTQLNVFNGGSTSVTATVTFYGTVGSNSTTITSSTTSLTIPAHQTANLNQNSLPSGFSGWAQITGSANTLVAQVLEQSPSQKFVAIANAIATPSTTEYAPAIFAGGYGGFYTGANIINPNANPVTVTVTYYDLSANMTATTPFSIPGYGVASIFQGNSSGNGLPSGGLPKNFVGSAAVSSQGGPIAMSVNENGGVTSAGNSRSGTYAAIANGGSTVGLPVISNGGYTYVTGDTIFNTSSQTVTATLTYYNTNGTAANIATKNFVVPGHGSVAFYQGDGSVPANFYGTAVITESAASPANSLIVTTNAQNIALFYTYSEPNS